MDNKILLQYYRKRTLRIIFNKKPGIRKKFISPSKFKKDFLVKTTFLQLCFQGCKYVKIHSLIIRTLFSTRDPVFVELRVEKCS